MILVRVRFTILLLLISLTVTIGAGAWSYGVAKSAGFKGPAETTLFLSLCAAAVQLFLGVALFRQAGRKRREMDSIADAVRYGGNLPAERLARFGPLGERILLILKDLSEAGERKSERISSLTGLLRVALSLVEEPVLVVALDGRVLEASKGALEDDRFKDLERGKTAVEDFLPEAQMSSILQEADRTHAAVMAPGKAVFYPVYSTRGQIAHFLVDFTKAGIRDFLNGLGERRAPPESAPKAPKAPKIPNALGKFLGRMRQGGKDRAKR